MCASLLRVNLHSATSWPSFSCELEPLIAAASSLDRAFAAQPSATVARREPGRLRLSEAERSVPHSVATGRDWPFGVSNDVILFRGIRAK